MTNALLKKQYRTFAEPVLRKALAEAESEHRKLQEAFDLLGWGNVPDELKIEIKDDIQAYKDELEGKYSTCDPYVLQRRKSVKFWVDCYLDGICSLNTAIKSLKVKSL
ncbi:MAG: hypothetical protein ACFCU6_07900 [Balneolaceae bacterium]